MNFSSSVYPSELRVGVFVPFEFKGYEGKHTHFINLIQLLNRLGQALSAHVHLGATAGHLLRSLVDLGYIIGDPAGHLRKAFAGFSGSKTSNILTD